MITDHQYFEFMQKLLGDQRGKNALNLTEWEANFLASFSRASRQTLWFTIGRRKATDLLWRKLGPEMNFPHPLDRMNERPKIAAAEADGCEYLVRVDDGPCGSHQRCCNEPAEYQEPGKLRYCRTHAEGVERDMKRAGRIVRLIKFQPPVN